MLIGAIHRMTTKGIDQLLLKANLLRIKTEYKQALKIYSLLSYDYANSELYIVIARCYTGLVMMM